MTKNKNGAVPSQQRRSVVTKNSVTMFNDDSTTNVLDCHKTPAGVLGWIRRLGGRLHAAGDDLILAGVDSPPAELLASISNHKIKLHQLVTAARGQWPGWDQD